MFISLGDCPNKKEKKNESAKPNVVQSFGFENSFASNYTRILISYKLFKYVIYI